MLSSTHTVFCGLQSHLRDILRNLPDSVSPQIKNGLVKAHHKLSDYYYKFDESLLYTWAAHKFTLSYGRQITDCVVVLDPHISYEGMCNDYVDDESLLEYLEGAKSSLHQHYQKYYANKTTTRPQTQTSGNVHGNRLGRLSSQGSPQKMNFTSHLSNKPKCVTDELEEYFKLSPEDYDSCDPIKWWMGR
ncbi:hypothetical protein EDD85DRAFT_955453 [Armillaria nabsnona]|nr:hypothetical protein EDD85DRAFT_955453 [Armillaria nabsnona]